MGLETDCFRKTMVYWRLSGVGMCVCACMCVSVCVWLTNINTPSLTRDLCRSQLDLIFISCFSRLLFFGKMFTQQARQISIYKYVIKNSPRERSHSDQHLGVRWSSTFPRDQKRWCFLPNSAHWLQIRCFQSKRELFLNSSECIIYIPWCFWTSFMCMY